MTDDLKYRHFEGGHLSSEGIALYVDAFRADKLHSLPPEIIHHIEACQECKAQAMELNSLLHQVSVSSSLESDLPSKFSYWKYLAIAASIILIIALAWFVPSMVKDTFEPEEIFAQYFKPYPDVITAKNSNNSGIKSALYLGLEYYANCKYDSALMLFELVNEDQENYRIARFYEANCLLAEEVNLEKAIILLEEASKDEKLFDLSNWYLSLAYIKKQDLDKAEDCLSRIDHLNTVNGKNAHKLLGIIRENKHKQQ